MVLRRKRRVIHGQELSPAVTPPTILDIFSRMRRPPVGKLDSSVQVSRSAEMLLVRASNSPLGGSSVWGSSVGGSSVGGSPVMGSVVNGVLVGVVSPVVVVKNVVDVVVEVVVNGSS